MPFCLDCKDECLQGFKWPCGHFAHLCCLASSYKASCGNRMSLRCHYCRPMYIDNHIIDDFIRKCKVSKIDLSIDLDKEANPSSPPRAVPRAEVPTAILPFCCERDTTKYPTDRRMHHFPQFDSHGQVIDDQWVCYRCNRVARLADVYNMCHLDCSTAPRCTSHGVCVCAYGHDFNQSLDNTILPVHLRTLAFCELFDQKLDRTTLPSGLRSITCSKEGELLTRALTKRLCKAALRTSHSTGPLCAVLANPRHIKRNGKCIRCTKHVEQH